VAFRVFARLGQRLRSGRNCHLAGFEVDRNPLSFGETSPKLDGCERSAGAVAQVVPPGTQLLDAAHDLDMLQRGARPGIGAGLLSYR
jgi:hypothetical protein